MSVTNRILKSFGYDRHERHFVLWGLSFHNPISDGTERAGHVPHFLNFLYTFLFSSIGIFRYEGHEWH